MTSLWLCHKTAVSEHVNVHCDQFISNIQSYHSVVLLYFPAKILYNSIISPLILLYFKVGILKSIKF